MIFQRILHAIPERPQGFITLIFAVLPTLAQRPTETFQGREAAANQVLVKFKSAHSPSEAQAEWLEDTDHAETINREGVIKLHSRGKSVATLVTDLMRRSDVTVPPAVLWMIVAVEGDTVFLPKGTTYRFGIDPQFLDPITTSADLEVYVSYTSFSGDPATGVLKELDVAGDGTGVIVNGVPFK